MRLGWKLTDDPATPRKAINSGHVLCTRRLGLINLLREWREAGVNHATPGIQPGRGAPAEVLQERAGDVLPLLHSHKGLASLALHR